MSENPCCSRRRRRRALMLLAMVKKRKRMEHAAASSQDHLRKILALCLALLLNCSNNVAASGFSGSQKSRRWWVRPILVDHDLHGAWNALIPTLRSTDPDLYYNFMRMTPESFDKLLKKVYPFLKKASFRKSICPGERLAITLRYLASGDSQVSLSYLFRVSNQAISKILLETTNVLWKVLKKDENVFPKLSQSFWLKVAAEFQVLWNIPHCLGAIDGKHVFIRAFAHCGSRYFSWKKRHSMSFMAVSDAKHRFIVVEAGASGKRADVNIFYKSTFAKKMANGSFEIPPPCPQDGVEGDLPFFWVGDSAYPQTGNIATPFKGNHLRPEEEVYNYRLSRARRIVENAFGILTARFRIMFRSIEGSPALVRGVILACLALHNYHLADEESVPPRRRKYRPYGYADYVREDGTYIYGRWRNEQPKEERTVLKRLLFAVGQAGRGTSIQGKELAEKLLRYFIMRPLDWQWKKAYLV